MQKFIYPYKLLRITGHEDIESHAGTLALDYNDVNELMVFTAPVDLKIIYKSTGAYTVIFETVDKCKLPNGQEDYLTISCGHMDSKELYDNFSIGGIVRAGETMYQAGTRSGDKNGAVARHIHVRVHKGRHLIPLWKELSNGNWTLNTTGGAMHHYDAMWLAEDTERYYWGGNSTSDKYVFKRVSEDTPNAPIDPKIYVGSDLTVYPFTKEQEIWLLTKPDNTVKTVSEWTTKGDDTKVDSKTNGGYFIASKTSSIYGEKRGMNIGYTPELERVEQRPNQNQGESRYDLFIWKDQTYKVGQFASWDWQGDDNITMGVSLAMVVVEGGELVYKYSTYLDIYQSNYSLVKNYSYIAKTKKGVWIQGLCDNISPRDISIKLHNLYDLEFMGILDGGGSSHHDLYDPELEKSYKVDFDKENRAVANAVCAVRDLRVPVVPTPPEEPTTPTEPENDCDCEALMKTLNNLEKEVLLTQELNEKLKTDLKIKEEYIKTLETEIGQFVLINEPVFKKQS